LQKFKKYKKDCIYSKAKRNESSPFSGIVQRTFCNIISVSLLGFFEMPHNPNGEECPCPKILD
jgi:hypothetical protein